MKFPILVLLFVTLALADLSGVEGGKKVLVIAADSKCETTNSIYFQNLRASGFSLKFVLSTKRTSIMKYGKALYDQVIIMAPEAENLCQISLNEFKEFIDYGNNIVIAVNEYTSKFVRDLVGNCGIDIDEEKSNVYDHFNYASLSKNMDHRILYTSQYPHYQSVFGNKKDTLQSIYFKGIGLTANDNIYTINTLVGEPSTFSLSYEQSILSSGKHTILVASLQARNNARVSVFGSLDMFSDEFTYFDTSSNADFVSSVSLWTFRQRGVLRYSNIHHCKQDGTEPDVMLKPKERANLPISNYPEPEVAPNNLVYRIKDDIMYSITIEEYKDGSWNGYNATDVQLEFRMLDPYVRITMVADSDTEDSLPNGHYVGKFKVPDVYGIYKFHLFYRRMGYTVLESNTQVSVRPFRHNEFPRFISAAYPYYTTVFTSLIGFIAFVAFFLFI